jgi:hypothetical protein
MDPHRKKTCPKGAEFFDLWVHNCTQGVKGYLMNFHGPRTRKTSWPKDQEVFHYWVHDSTSVSNMSLSKS